MDTDTHEKFTAAFFKNAGLPVNMKLIKNVNYTIDNSPAWTQAMGNFFNKRQKLMGQDNRFQKNPYDIFNLVQGGGHRSRNHDMLSGMFISAMNARAMGVPASHAMLATYSHYAADHMSNQMVNKMGTEGRNMFEALYSWQTRKNQNKSMF